MKITLKEITVHELVAGYENDGENGVLGYHALLNIRPPYQREFVYKDKQRDAVIDTINKSYPLNSMYWAVNDNGTYEVIDGQQRTISICEYVNNKFSINDLYFSNLPNDKQDKILDYKLMVYFCEGTASEKLEWFEVINIAGEKLTKQELRNAIYSGPWLTDAKRYFSRKNQGADKIAGGLYLKGSVVRQDFLETALNWISDGNIEQYMSEHQHATNANELWLHFKKVIDWVDTTFPQYRSEMKGIDWGFLYKEAERRQLDAGDLDPGLLETVIKELMMDDDVTKKSGIYYYIITDDEKYLSIRNFSERERRFAYERQNGICTKCGKHFEYEEMEADHITPWSEGGKTKDTNCQMLCKHCNRVKSNK